MPREPLRFLVGQETECLTVAGTAGQAAPVPATATRFLEIFRHEAPSLPCVGGFFNGYGRVYLDGGHVEFATAESDSPYELPLLIERQEQLAARTLAHLEETGTGLILADVNYSGVLRRGGSTWGCHENYLVERPSTEFGPRMLPFLATRVFAGAGGVLASTGEFIAGTRVPFLDLDVGGGTTTQRALHSTARQEHLVGSRSGWHRYHLILGDGNRSQFTQTLKCGTTLLALKAVTSHPDRIVRLPGTPSPNQGTRAFWMRALRRFNVLCRAGEPPQANRTALRVQRLYLDAVRRWSDEQRELPAWVPRLIADWEHTLGSLAADNQGWLGRRLDPWIKYELFSAALKEWGCRWSDLPHRPGLFARLALLNQDYHRVGHSDSVFQRLHAAGVLDHRVREPIAPGGEPEPFVPETTTRAAARARFIKAHAGYSGLVANWDHVEDMRTGHRWSLADPFANQFTPLARGTGGCEPS